jgi:hypothetical protein
MNTKNRIDTSDILNDIPFRIVDKRDLLRVSQKDVVDIINQLTSTFLKSFGPVALHHQVALMPSALG